MKATSFVLYEIGMNEIKQLPHSYEVLEVDTWYDRSAIKHVGEDRFRHEKGRYKHYLFKAPPLNVATEFIKQAATV